MLSIGKLAAGAAAYFEGEVAAGREDYYAGVGEAPGRWLGSLAAGLGLEGLVPVGGGDESPLSRHLAQQHPITGEFLGNDYAVGGSFSPSNDPSAGAKGSADRKRVGGFDLTFSVPKSVSALYAVGDEFTRIAIAEALNETVDAVVGHLEDHAAWSRVGKAGRMTSRATGLSVARFDHRTSRAGDPQLHAHLLVANRVQRAGTAGVLGWGTLDGRALYSEAKAAGMLGHAVLRSSMSRLLGVDWLPANGHGQAELAGVPAELVSLWSKRSAHVVEVADSVIGAKEAGLGRGLTAAERRTLTRHATLRTRQSKAAMAASGVPTGIDGLRDRWAAEAEAHGFRLGAVVEDTVGRHRPDGLGGVSGGSGVEGPVGFDAVEVIEAALESLGAGSSSWTLPQARQHVLAQLPVELGRTGPETRALLDRLTQALVSAAETVEVAEGVPVASVRSGSDESLHDVAAVRSGSDESLRDVAASRSTPPPEPTPPLAATGSERTASERTASERAASEQSAPEDSDLSSVPVEPTEFSSEVRETAPHQTRYATKRSLLAEARVMAWAADLTTPNTTASTTAAPTTAAPPPPSHPARHDTTLLDPVVSGRGRLDSARLDSAPLDSARLDSAQQAAVDIIVGSDAPVVSIVGPAGAGKSTTMRTANTILTDSGVPVRGVTVSAAAAEVLRSEAGIVRCDNLAKLIHEADRRTPGWGLQSGEVVIVDEASMLSTRQWEWLAEQARTNGARVIAVGDPAQLAAVGAGGMFGWMTRNTPTIELGTIHRFTTEGEGAASLRLRELGDVDWYTDHGRIVDGGDLTETLDRVRDIWRTSRRDGAELLVMAQTRSTVRAVSEAIRAERVLAGELEPGVLVPTGSGPIGLAPGDVVMTRRNDRTLVDGVGGWVRNGDRWTVTAIDDPGPNQTRGVTLTRLDDPAAMVELPAEYMHNAASLEYGYAMTAHKAQGQTVDTAVVIVDDRTNREALYVGLTRGRHSNIAIAVTRTRRDEAHGPEHDSHPTALAAIQAAASRIGTEQTGAELLANRWGHTNLGTLADLITAEADDDWQLDAASIGGTEMDVAGLGLLLSRPISTVPSLHP